MEGIELSKLRLGEMIDLLMEEAFTPQREKAARVQSALVALHVLNKQRFKGKDPKEFKDFLFDSIQEPEQMEAAVLASALNRAEKPKLQDLLVRARAHIDDEKKAGGFGPGPGLEVVASFGEILTNNKLGLVEPRLKNAIMLVQQALRIQVLLHGFEPGVKYPNAREDGRGDSEELKAAARAFNRLQTEFEKGNLQNLDLDQAAFDWPIGRDETTQKPITQKLSLQELCDETWKLGMDELLELGHNHAAMHVNLAGYELGMTQVFNGEPFMLNYGDIEEGQTQSLYQAYNIYQADQADAAKAGVYDAQVDLSRRAFFQNIHAALTGGVAADSELVLHYIGHLGFKSASTEQLIEAFSPANAPTSVLAAEIFEMAHYKALLGAWEWEQPQQQPEEAPSSDAAPRPVVQNRVEIIRNRRQLLQSLQPQPEHPDVATADAARPAAQQLG